MVILLNLFDILYGFRMTSGSAIASPRVENTRGTTIVIRRQRTIVDVNFVGKAKRACGPPIIERIVPARMKSLDISTMVKISVNIFRILINCSFSPILSIIFLSFGAFRSIIPGLKTSMIIPNSLGSRLHIQIYTDSLTRHIVR